MTNLKNHIAGALYGVAVGDALGGPLEFMTAEQIKKTHGRVTTMIGGGWLNLRPGETTDDTAMTLAVAEGIIANPEDPTEEIGRRFLAWADSGPKDIGGTCAAAIYYARAEARTKGLDTPPAPPAARTPAAPAAAPETAPSCGPSTRPSTTRTGRRPRRKRAPKAA